MVPELEKVELLDGQLGLKKRKSRDRELLWRMFWGGFYPEKQQKNADLQEKRVLVHSLGLSCIV
ncbi:hypothetical protein ACS0TY_029855 [Phlomoides rotata]